MLLASLLLSGTLTGCRTLTPSPSGFSGYVALGDSLTAGMQSVGLTAQNQRDSFPLVLSRLAGSPIHAPESLPPGCPPPFAQGITITTCVRANPLTPASNFGVPGASLYDVGHTSYQTAPDLYKPLYGLILGPEDTQLSAALRARPRFITLWAGSNDVLGVTLRGRPERATTPANFEKWYGELLDNLAPTGARIVLIEVPDITTAPSLIPGSRLHVLGLGGADCERSPNRVSFTVLYDRRIAKPVSCTAPYALTPVEREAAQNTVNAYNTSIRALGKARGYPVFNATELLREVTPFEYDPKAPMPFGVDFSNDGVHPSSLGQARIARGLAEFINKQFGTTIELPERLPNVALAEAGKELSP
ncbi:SGNH/GDSL hydrolase family protein [Deinococcus peraridilitoris]|uniref:GDSL-like Lipase/Acylhydrolase n=1 Tax=Deinococcus peraridilitoris (strain DSM 19664 / LMG 22246 / CIP 109416 / KR-200) TaxID=937777 RepID=K9ZZG8_DEIPD|nr:SGNH/GDSL hydrolase family protein [Deinococcus peraridilitoris]AFZ66332.1 GDSL-like Lipase/Acylhydrolase [Deinococcus peraridilitoris DSM 19664]